MAKNYCTVFLILLQISIVINVRQFLIYDFNNNDNVTEWIEQSDTSKKTGMSKAALVLLETDHSRRAVLFTLLNAQPNGNGFAGVGINTQLNLNNYHTVALRVRGQGKNKWYKLIVRQNVVNNNQDQLEHCHLFEAPFGDYNVIKLPLKGFKPYYKNKPVNNTETLKWNEIKSIGLQVYGGDSTQKKQSGVSSLEMDWIIALG